MVWHAHCTHKKAKGRRKGKKQGHKQRQKKYKESTNTRGQKVYNTQGKGKWKKNRHVCQKAERIGACTEEEVRLERYRYRDRGVCRRHAAKLMTQKKAWQACCRLQVGGREGIKCQSNACHTVTTHLATPPKHQNVHPPKPNQNVTATVRPVLKVLPD